MTARAGPPAYARLVLRIIDARTGEPAAAAPARRGLTRVEAHASGSEPTDLRVLLVADLLVRALEIGGTPVWALLTGGHRQAELRARAAALGIRPFEDSHDVGAGLGEAQVVHVAAEGGPAPDGLRIAVAPVRPDPPGPLRLVGPSGSLGSSGASELPGPADPPGPSGLPDPSGEAHLTDEAGPSGEAGPSDEAGPADPAALRLALFARHHSVGVRLDEAALGEARTTLARWRAAVARWARRPSRPVPDDVRARLRDAWEDDLDVPGVLEVLRRVESDPELPDGARFETYAHADRLLGLDLTRDLGSS
ncbi:hypothetical protein AB0N88_32575 [Streptomyces sp. NPDC093516]|uniref:hypothetical protein n=1 Tax=Streptomyces sp. NPDC093516 TaxID=3155304 RepID=UPI003431B867